MRKKTKKGSGGKVLFWLLFATLLAGGIYLVNGRHYRLPAWRRPRPVSRLQAVATFKGRMAAYASRCLQAKVLASDTSALPSQLLSLPQNCSLLFLNYQLSRIALASGLKLCQAYEDHKKGTLELTYSFHDTACLRVRAQKKRLPTAAVAVRPRLALVLCELTPDNRRAAAMLLKRPEIKTVVLSGFPVKTDREVLASLPLEPIGYPKQDPGPNTILIDDGDLQVKAKLNRICKGAGHPAGLSAYDGSRALKDKRVTDLVISYCRQNALVFVEPVVTVNSLARETAELGGCPYLAAAILIERKASLGSCVRSLQQALAQTAKQPRTLVYAAVSDNLAKAVGKIFPLSRSDVDFVAASELAK